jgi:glycosyltransferase involved in cell wall biosynthesis
MRVLIVSQYFWPEEFRINDVAKTLVEKGIDVDVLSGKPNYPIGRLFDGYRIWDVHQQSWNGVNIYRIPMLVRGKGGLSLALNYLSFVISALMISPWLLRHKKYDVIFTYAPSPISQAIPSLFLGWLKKLPTVLWVQDLWPESLTATGYVRNKVILALVKSVVRFIYSNTSILLVQSRAFIEPVHSLAGTTPIIYYPNSVDDKFAMPASKAAPELKGVERGFTVMFAGNIGKAQGVDVILSTAVILRDYSDIHFVVLGDGSSRLLILQTANDLGLINFHMPGRFPEETMPAFMQKASVLLVTLTNQPIFAMTVPNKIQAYLAAGKPIIACLNGEGARIVTEANAGLVVPAENTEALAQAILQLYKLPESERDKMGSNGRRYFQENFNHDVLVEKLIKHLAKAAQK